MDGEKLLQFEKASVDMMVYCLANYEVASVFTSALLQSPPHSVTEERRKEAEAMFMELRNSKMPYSTCKFILGSYKMYSLLSWAVTKHLHTDEVCDSVMHRVMYSRCTPHTMAYV